VRTGKGYQTLINDALSQYLGKHPSSRWLPRRCARSCARSGRRRA